MAERGGRVRPGFWARQTRWLAMLLASLAGFTVSMGAAFVCIQLYLAYDPAPAPPAAVLLAQGERLHALANDLVALAQDFRDYAPQGEHRLTPQEERWFDQEFLPRVNHFKLRLADPFEVDGLPPVPLEALRAAVGALYAAGNAPEAQDRGRTALRAVEAAVQEVTRWDREMGLRRYLRTPLRHPQFS